MYVHTGIYHHAAFFLLLPYIFGPDDLLCSHPNLIVSNSKSTTFCEIQGKFAISIMINIHSYLCISQTKKLPGKYLTILYSRYILGDFTFVCSKDTVQCAFKVLLELHKINCNACL